MNFQGNKKVLIPAVLCLVFLGIASNTASAFVPSKSTSAISSRAPSRPISKVSLEAGVVPTTAEAIQEMANARFAFGMCFYGALGVGSIGRELIPIVFGRYQDTSSLESDGSVAANNRGAAGKDGEDLGIWGYPEKIYRKDVEMILNNRLTPLAIAKKYPIEQNEDADKRYTYTHMTEVVPFLGYDGFVKANPRANPVALRAVFDSFSNSIGGSNAVSPITAQRNIDSFLTNKAVTGELAKKLNGGKSIGIAAFVFLLALLGIGDALAIFHLWKGWFPEWQGFSDMPASLFDKNIGVTVLPNFFVGDVPPMP
eukprot:CAMPEP_0116142898 /NCGR_PEP_ID=MMETSP0329-20121206/15155_1 /TAXON_ID=697910 /ORGANISM="Pseudo-nitzschia arenysensis, Strain B593" /LENGTH=311 /DNA_ID=CAMNT_0003638167 /DNA_START=52 /DNA_END=987 /DNA_ORIENTATION=-